MTKYHINDEQVAGVCRAKKKCRFGESGDHFRSIAEASKYVESKLELEKFLETSRNGKVVTLESTLQALESSLEYNGPVPKWFQKFTENSVRMFERDEFKVEPKILDKVEIGDIEALVVWEEHSSDLNDIDVQEERGYECHRLVLKDFENGETIGYLKVGYVSDDSLDRSFGNYSYAGLSWMEDNGGSTLGVRAHVKDGDYVDELTGKSGNELLEAKKKIWAKAHAGMEICPEGFDRTSLTWGMLINLSPKHAPDDEEKLDEDLKSLNQVAIEKRNEFKREHNIPSIDYSYIDNHYRGKGLGQALYVYSARMMGKKELVLRGSGIQTELAENSWKRLAADERLNAKVIDRPYDGSKKACIALDFRGQ